MTTIAYSDLVTAIESIQLEPFDVRLNHLLAEISQDEDLADRGMLSVLVVHKEGDQQPGPGFLKLAEELGYSVVDRDVFWVDMLHKVYKTWAEK